MKIINLSMNMMESVKMKKGFTLIELLVVIVLLGILAAIVTTSIISIMNNSRKSLSDTQINTIEEAAIQWGTINADKLPLDDSVYSVDIKTLADDGFIDSSELQDPGNNSNLCGVVEIKYDTSKNQYKYEFVRKDCP